MIRSLCLAHINIYTTVGVNDGIYSSEYRATAHAQGLVQQMLHIMQD